MKKFLISVSLLIAFFSATKMVEAQDKKPVLTSSLAKPYVAPEFSEIDKWLNSEPLKMEDLKGKVVLIEFWTYSCINCIRTFPYINKLHEKYAKDGLVIVGVHSPEFEFEKRPENVNTAIRQFKIGYPVAMDNRMATWKSYANQYWPAHYLIDKDGMVVYTHFGEGNYPTLENNIRLLLGLDQAKSDPKNLQTVIQKQTPETYLGSDRSSRNSNESLKTLTYPAHLPPDSWALQGNWKITKQFVQSQKADDAIRLNFKAKKVFAVMMTEKGTPVDVDIFIDGKRAITNNGSDVSNGIVTVKNAKLYELVNLEKAGNTTLELNAKAAGLQIYTFTFGDK